MRIALVAVMIASAMGQAGGQPFAGRWAADVGGQPVVRLELRVSNGTLTGSMQLADIHVDKHGDVETVLSSLPPATPLIDIATRNEGLAFSRRDGNDIDRFELTLRDDGAAELLFVPSDADRRELAEQGIPAPRPIRLTRTTP